MTTLQEYDLEFKRDTIINVQGLCKFLAEIHANEGYNWENEAELNLIHVCPIFTTTESWYTDLVHYLQQVHLPKHWNSK